MDTIIRADPAIFLRSINVAHSTNRFSPMFAAPRPRFRFYGFPKNYWRVLAHLSGLGRAKANAVQETERELARFLDVKHVVCAPQGRIGMYLGLSAIIEPGQKVVMSPYTLYDVVNMVLCAGGVPIFADVDARTGNIDPAAVEALLDNDVGAVLVTHLHGIGADMEKLDAICSRHRVPLLEDACQAFGAKLNGRHLGTIGKIGFFSTGRAKNLNSFLGGFVVTDDDRIAEHMRSRLAEWPLESGKKLFKRIAHCLVGDVLTRPPTFSIFTFWLFRYGVLNDVESLTRQFDTEVNPVRRDALPDTYKRRMTPLQANLIRQQLGDVDENARQRLELARIYHSGLSNIGELVVPTFSDDGSDVYLAFPVQVSDRGKLQKYMAKHLRDVTIQHIRNTADLKVFEQFHRDCPNAKRVANSVLLLPTYPGYGAREAQKNVEVIRDYLIGRNAV